MLSASANYQDGIPSFMYDKCGAEEGALVYAALILADAGQYITANKMQILTDAANVEVTPMLPELLAKTLEGISLRRALLGHPITATRYLATLPDELVLQIAIYAGEVVPEELQIRHPADDRDPLFVNGKLAPKYEWEDRWKKALSTRLNMVRVCRRFRRIATPVLYSSYFACRSDQVEPFSMAIQRNPHLGQHIRRLDFMIGRYAFVPVIPLQDLLKLCPNLLILSTPIPLDPDCLPVSLRSLQIKSGVEYQHDWDVAKVLRRLKHLERLSLRLFLTSCGGSSDSEANSTGSPHSALRTDCFEGTIPDEIIERISTPKSSIQSIQIRHLDKEPSKFLSSYILRAESLTHLSLSQSWIGSFPPNFSLPTLQHIHIRASSLVTGPELNTIGAIGPITSLGCTFGDGTLHSTTEWINPLTLGGSIHRIFPKFKRIFTDRKSLRKTNHTHDLPSRVREWAERTDRASGFLEWLVQSGVEIVSVRDILDDIENESVIEEESDDDFVCCCPFD